MNKYPAWLNVLVLVVLLTGILLALPNLYGSAPAIQLADRLGEPITESQLREFVSTVEGASIEPEAAFLKDDRAVLRFETPEAQTAAGDRLRDRYGRDLNIALTLAPRLPAWVRGIGLNPMSLGLDLRGGIYVLLEVDMESAINKRLESYQQDFDDRLREARIRHRVDLENNVITVRLSDSADYETSMSIVRTADPEVLINDGTDDKSFTVRMSETQIRARQDFAIEQNITTLRNRVDELGVAEPLVQRQGLDRIVVQLPGVQDPTELDKILTATATVEFRLVDQSGNQPGSRRYPGRGQEPAQILKREVIASGDEIVNASAGFSSEGQPAVNITLDAAGGERMLATTRDNLNKPMSTVFIEWKEETVTRGGKSETRRVKSEEIINTATIRGVFKNNFQITGLNPIEASDLAKLLRAGALAAPVYKVDDRTIGPTLGQENIDRGFKAIQIGFLAVIIFMVVYYRVFGLIANVALLSNLVFIVAVLSLLGASLTLPGIAGIVLTVGMAVDANVLIFERIREELAAGTSPQQAIHSGYDKALSSIADANITTLIAAIVLLGFGTGPIKGFAITLMIGILTSMFTAIVGTRTIVNLAFGGRKLQGIPV
ncbi:MAG: protein translocase subunit SecD [Gammaproteobacteria bacterium]|jgi:preprotein translocase subunit SecD|nr:protein translocase subunit SecD [Gammaproteobacteria bacterium]MDH3848505.1 protein translocase subunit SecD [Gammaproteobacteria bacterium]MDH3863520.1 protein translocase subunit SecD [Gammaproteobacteria bacterium]MDH3904210.1 protein translocase subunit SecD [Gammaproteobacteria bacterium]MDH3952783.1 protein translocase subunit SecD [Gammaproteobacteria bacterium]